MKNLTIKEMWKISKASNTPLLGEYAKLITLPFMREYAERFAEIDRTFTKEKGNFYPIWNRNEFETNSEILNEFRSDVFALLYKKKENYQRLWDLMGIEYDPIENYSMVEEGNDSGDGRDVTVETLGEKVHIEAKGQDTITDTYGAENESLQHGAQSTSQTLGAKHQEGTQQRAAFNTSSYSNNTKGIVDDNAVTNGESSQAYTDSRTTQQKIDTHVTGARTDTFTDEEVENSTQVNYGKILNHYLTRRGNIGVTTSQQMAESEVNLWRSFNFYDIIFDDIVKELCIFFDDGIYAFNDGRPYFFDIVREEDPVYNVFVVETYKNYAMTEIESVKVLTDQYYPKSVALAYPTTIGGSYRYVGYKVNGGAIQTGTPVTVIVDGPKTVEILYQKVGD